MRAEATRARQRRLVPCWSNLCRPWLTAVLVAALLGTPGAAPPAHAQRKPLSADEQDQVNRAIDAGVAFLKATQRAHGSWAEGRDSHPIGYAALPGLTLLECEVPASDPAVQRVARLVRRSAANLDGTYEISLSILFLDRLGDPRDKALIRTLAVRLMAGQTTTGGWSYKCPKPSAATQQELLTLLRRLDPGMPIAIPRPGQPGNFVPAIKGGDDPGAVAAKGGPDGGRPVADKGGDGGRPVADGGRPAPGDRPIEGGTGGPSIGERPAADGGTPTPGGVASAPSLPDPPRLGAPGRRWCIKSSDWTADRQADQRAWKAPPPPRVVDVVPPRLRTLPIFVEGGGMLVDPAGRGNQPLAGTTDNSNTQFALLALWAAQRHGVPVRRSLDLIVRRFNTSQNLDGSWGYHYRFGGGEPERPAMTCVGLLGLAVGHGIAGRADGPVVADPAILKGMVALSKHVGEATGRQDAVRQINLYVLWSIERVAVLYGLPTIGGKDWYRWAAEMLVLNQQRQGHWTAGGYHKATPVIDTCLALLVLKKANLTRDLAGRLPFDPGQLERAITAQTVRPGGGPPKGPPDPPAPPTSPVLPVSLPIASGPDAGNPDPPTAPTPPAASTATPEEGDIGGRSPVAMVLLGLLLLLLVVCLGVAGFFMLGQGKQAESGDDEPEADRPRRRPSGRRR